MYGLISASAIFYSFVIEKDIRQKLLWGLCGLVGIYLTIRTSKYSVLIAIAIVCFINAMVYLKKKKTYIAIVLFGFFTYGFFFTKLSNKLDIVNRARTSFSPSDSMNIRVYMWKLYLSEMMSRPFSGISIRNPYYTWAHNLFLDVYIQNGIIVMGILILLYFLHYIDVLKLLRTKQNELAINDANKSFWFSVSIALSSVFFTEPVYEAAPILVVYLFAVFACVRKMQMSYGICIENA